MCRYMGPGSTSVSVYHGDVRSRRVCLSGVSLVDVTGETRDVAHLSEVVLAMERAGYSVTGVPVSQGVGQAMRFAA